MAYKVNKSVSAKENLYALIQYTWPDHADVLNEDNVSVIVEPSSTPGVLSVTLSPSESAVEVIGVKTATYNVVDLTLIDTSDFISDPENLLGGVDAYIETLACVPSEITVSAIDEDEENGWSIDLSAIENAITVKGSVTLDLNVGGGGGTGPGDGGDGDNGDGEGDGNGDDDGSGGGGGPGVVDNSHITPDTPLSISTLGQIQVSTGVAGNIDYSLDGGDTWVELAPYATFINPPNEGESEILFRANEGATVLSFTGTMPANIENFLGVNEWWGSSCRIAIPIHSNEYYVPLHSPRFMTDLSGLFGGATAFNTDISGWDMSHVTNMSNMLRNCREFNYDIGNWDVSNVTSMENALSMPSFNQDISKWDVSKVENMASMFSSATAFNQDISSWDVSNVTNMRDMFRSATSFNQDLSSWCVGRIGSKPSGFDSYTYGIMPQWRLPKPIWGTCPPR